MTLALMLVLVYASWWFSKRIELYTADNYKTCCAPKVAFFGRDCLMVPGGHYITCVRAHNGPTFACMSGPGFIAAATETFHFATVTVCRYRWLKVRISVFKIPTMLYTAMCVHTRICSVQSGNLHNLEIALRILGIPRLRNNLLPRRACASRGYKIERSY